MSPICLEVPNFPLLPGAATEAGFICPLPEILCVATCIYSYLQQLGLSSVYLDILLGAMFCSVLFICQFILDRSFQN